MKYNLKFICKKILLCFSWIIAILTFHTIYYLGYSQYSAVDIYLVSIGGVAIENLHLIQIFIVLLPYFAIAIIVDVYMTQMIGRPTLYSMIRMKNKLYFILSHILTLFIIIFFMLFVYNGLLMLISFTVYDGKQLSEVLFPWIYVLGEDVLFKLLLSSFFGQLLGTFCLSCIQIAISINLNPFGGGFICAVFIYILQLIFPFAVGQHAFVFNILKDNFTYISFIFTQLLIAAASVIYIYFISKKNIMIFSERN